MRFSFLPAIFLLLPFAEIAGFILVGQAIGVLATLGLVIATSMLGIFLLRQQGLGILRKISTESRGGGVPSRELVHAAMIVIAGFLLLLPGFITDIIGLLFFIPPVRDLAWKLFSPRIVVMGSKNFYTSGHSAGPRPARGGPVVDLDGDDFHRDPDPNSPWSDKPRIGD
ncbi:membrane protein FxsA [Rhizobium sp. LjRoot30]|uniref:FxsA family protein n=1 Tax=Rhizobium sp. LjRoot30 TaxID=3342320 RepID=UPI003ECCEAEF